MALPGSYNYQRYGISHLDLPEPMDYYPEQLIIPAPRGARHLAAPNSSQAVYATQPLHGSTHSGYPPIHVHAGATFNATIHMNIYPNNHSTSSFPSPDHHPIIFPRIDDNHQNHHHHHHHSVTVDPSSQCHHCDHRFDTPYLLTAHKNRNSLHCACCRECFASWPDHYERSGGCSAAGGGGGGGRNYYSNDDDLREHFWLNRDHHHHHRGGGRVLGEVRDLELRGGGGFYEDEGVYYGPEGWVIEERHRRSRTRRRRGRSRGRYGATSAWRSFFL